MDVNWELEEAQKLLTEIEDHCAYYFSHESPDMPSGYVQACWDILLILKKESV